MPKTKIIKKPKDDVFKLILRFDDLSYTSSGSSILEALEGLAPKVIKGKGLLTVTKGSKKAEKILYPLVVRRLLVNKVLRELLQKTLLMALQ